MYFFLKQKSGVGWEKSRDAHNRSMHPMTRVERILNKDISKRGKLVSKSRVVHFFSAVAPQVLKHQNPSRRDFANCIANAYADSLGEKGDARQQSSELLSNVSKSLGSILSNVAYKYDARATLRKKTDSW